MDNTRLFLFAALVFVGMLLWQQWQADYGPQPVASSDSQVGNTASGTGTGQQAVVDDLPDLAEGISKDSSQGDSAGTTSSAETQQLVRVDTDVFEVLIDTRGGVIRSLKLKQYPISLEQPDEGLEL
ncbi:MAG: membrane protein insertase YidC, partial [Gammaproteobacteria bacterium]